MSKPKEKTLSDKELAVIGKYFNSVNDFKKVSETCKEYVKLVDLYRENPIPLNTEREVELFPNIETYRASNANDLQMILLKEDKPSKIKMDYAEDISKKQRIKNMIENEGIEFEGNFKSPIRIFMDDDVTELKSSTDEQITRYSLIDLSNTKIREIPEMFFYEFHLTEIRLPTTLTKIGDAAFMCCYQLKKVRLPETLKVIGRGAFNDCQSLEQISMPSSLAILEDNAFNNCNKLEQLILPKSLHTLGHEVFRSCSKLSYISVPSSVTSMGTCVFEDCGSLVLMDFNPQISVLPEKTFCECESLKKITLPIGITRIEDECFKNCYRLERIINLEGVRGIARNAFEGCGAIREPYGYIIQQKILRSQQPQPQSQQQQQQPQQRPQNWEWFEPRQEPRYDPSYFLVDNPPLFAPF